MEKGKDPDARAGIDGDDPMAPVGPDKCDAPPDDCEIGPDERSDGAGGSDYSMRAELDDAFLVEALATPLAADGLPDHSVDGSPDGVPAFTIDTVCCIEDESEYVELFYEEVSAKGMHVELALVGADHHRYLMQAYRRFHADGSERQRQVFAPKQVARRWGQEVVRVDEVGPVHYWLPVRPIRPRCIWYKRQMFGNDDQPDPTQPGHRLVFRVCTHPARRSIGGAAMSLRDEAIYSCDLREPHDPRSNYWLDAFDGKKIEERPDLIRLPLFNMPGDVVVVQERGSS